jgi:hypothetical protein
MKCGQSGLETFSTIGCIRGDYVYALHYMFARV